MGSCQKRLSADILILPPSVVAISSHLHIDYSLESVSHVSSFTIYVQNFH